jgi:hypothetical protein
MTSLADPAFVDQLVTRLGKLHPQRPRAWGRMTPHEMLCHLSDSFQVALGERHAAPADTFMQRTVIKYVALRTSMAWPKGLETRPPIFAALTREEWLIWGYRHTDHHLRQFAL